MIPTLYDKTGNNKIGDLTDCIECLVEEERNGIFELTMIYPANSSILESIVYDNIIVADANDYLKSQKFRVYNTRKLMANRIEVCARHISFDLVHDWVDVISIENQSCEYALNTIFRNSQFSKHFKGHSDIVNAQNFKVNKVTCLEAIGGTSGSIIDTYGTGAEILRDNTDIHVLNRRGHDNDVTIEYRKNLTGLEVEEDTTDLVTRIMPYAIYTNSNNEEVEVRGDFINSPLINNYAHPYVKYMDYSEEFEDGEVPTKTKLNNLATKEYTINKIDIPKCNYKIEFIPLSKCAGYEGLEDRINLCDVVTVKDSRYNIDTQAKVIKVVFDVLRGRYDSMELGEPRTTLGDIIGGTGDGPTQGPPGPPGPQGPAGADGSIGDFPQTLPEVPNITAKVYGFANIELSWTFENKVYYSYELYASKTKGFTPNTFNLIFSGQASTFLYQVNPNETWYFRACALNTHGQRTEFSSEVEVSTVKISDLSNYVESAAIGDALIGELNLGRGWYGELKGNYIDARQLSVTDGSGKRTLDIDSFGNVNLDVTSLKIKNNSVATESFVSNAKNDAINSANNNTAIALENHYTKSETDGKISVAKNEITSSVSSTYETKTEVANKINGVNSSISSLQTRMNTAESKITDTAITNTVKQNFYTKTETENAITSKGYATQSQVQQTADNIQFKFTQTGGYNLVRNGNPKPHNYRHWWVSGNANWYLGSTTDIGVQTIDTNEAYAGSATFKVEPGKTYSFSCWLMAESNTKGTDVYFLGSANDDGAHTEVHHLFTSGSCGWTQVKKTFTVGSNINYGFIRIDNNGRKDTSNGDFTVVFFSEVQMVKGSECYPQWSPNPNEVYDGLTTIDKEGITVTASNVRSKTKMSADGFQLIRTTDDKKMFYVNQYGSLEMSGNFTQYDSNGNISIKVANNSYGCYDWLWSGDYVGKLTAFETTRTNAAGGANHRFIGIANVVDYGNQLVLGVRSDTNSEKFNSYVEIDNTGAMHLDYVTFTANTGFKTNALFRNPNSNYETGRIFGATNNHLYVACNYGNQLRLGYEKNGSYYYAMSIYRNDNTSAGCAIEYYADEVHHNNVMIDGFLSVKGQKNRLVATENFGDRLLNAYETAECYFGDINEAIIGEDGEVKVELDEVFLETVNTTETYHVFLTKYGEGDCYVSERHEKYFIIKGTPNLSVGFEIKAKQRGYEKERLKMAVDTLKSHQTTSLENEAGYTIDCETTINRA